MNAQNLLVLTNIIGAVESGGQVYGKRRYSAYAAPYTNTAKEHTITIGWYQAYGHEARTLISEIQKADPTFFKKVDTANIASMLSKDWEKLRWNPTAKQKEIIISLIDSSIGHKVQDEIFISKMKTLIADCEQDYTKDIKAQMMYCEIRHLGGKGPVDRIFKRCKGKYDLDSIMVSLVADQNDTSSSNQVGDKKFWSRHVKCRQFIDQYAVNETAQNEVKEKPMAVIIGSARGDEYGRASGGSAGDQKQKSTPDYKGEVSMQDWYKHSKGWVLIRAKDPAAREKIAKNMEYACNNVLIGYDQSQNRTLFKVAEPLGFDCSKVKTKCETDCAQLVRVCVRYAGIKCDDFYTATEKDVLKRTGKFDIFTDDDHTKKSDYLLRGDILVTKTKGHTVVVLSNGSKAKKEASSGTSINIVVATNAIIKFGQEESVKFTKHKLGADGIRGKKTREQAVRVLQEAMNRDYDAGLLVDGDFGPKTKKALSGHYVKKGETQYMVTAAEILLALKGVNPNGIEYPGVFGSGLEKAAGKSYLNAAWFKSMTE